MAIDTTKNTNGKTPATPAASAPNIIKLPELRRRFATVTVKGSSPLIVHAWSEKAQKEMLRKQMKEASAGKAAKVPEDDFRQSLYYIEGGPTVPLDECVCGFKVIAFKAAAVRAGTYAEMKMTFLRGAFFVEGPELIRINGPSPIMRQDMVRVGAGVADIRFRGEFSEWQAEIPVSWNATTITLEQVVNLFSIGGYSVGVGEWRPEKDGPFGRFEVTDVVESV